MKHLRQYIRQIILEDSALGKWVWPSALGPTAPDEPDTDIEEKMYQQLHNHFGAIAPLSDEAITAVQQILDSGEYSDVFSRCDSGRMYRGMRVSLSWLEEHLHSLEDTEQQEQQFETIFSTWMHHIIPDNGHDEEFFYHDHSLAYRAIYLMNCCINSILRLKASF